MKKNKILIIRFSSFGDIWQAHSAIGPLVDQNFEIHWLTKKEFVEIVNCHSKVSKVISYDKKTGVLGLVSLVVRLYRAERYTHIYDAHNNTRSLIIRLVFLFISSAVWISRPKDRLKRWLFFKWRINKFKGRFVGVDSYTLPIMAAFNIQKAFHFPMERNYFFSEEIKKNVGKYISGPEVKKVGIVASAAWPLKRWPLKYFKELIAKFPADVEVYILGGPTDLFLSELKDCHQKIIYTVGQLSLVESSYLISQMNFVIANDSGLLHVADALNIGGVALQGPTAFGYTKGPKILNAEINLSCRPCSKDGNSKCTNAIQQKCLVYMTPEYIWPHVKAFLK